MKDIPGITDEAGIKVYSTDDIMFVIENGYITYVQTLVPDGGTKQE
jgi:hypothetical protein